jgi:hypothetical protein
VASDVQIVQCSLALFHLKPTPAPILFAAHIYTDNTNLSTIPKCIFTFSAFPLDEAHGDEIEQSV